MVSKVNICNMKMLFTLISTCIAFQAADAQTPVESLSKPVHFGVSMLTISNLSVALSELPTIPALDVYYKEHVFTIGGPKWSDSYFYNSDSSWYKSKHRGFHLVYKNMVKSLKKRYRHFYNGDLSYSYVSETSRSPWRGILDEHHSSTHVLYFNTGYGISIPILQKLHFETSLAVGASVFRGDVTWPDHPFYDRYTKVSPSATIKAGVAYTF